MTNNATNASPPPVYPRRRDDLTVRHAGERAMVVDGRGNELGVLNATALALWDLCDGTTSRNEMIDAVCTLWAVPRDVAERDVAAALRQLADLGFVE